MSDDGRAELSLEELAMRTGADQTDIARWRELALVGSSQSDRFSTDDVERSRLIQLCLRRGISLDALVRAEQQPQGFLRRYLGLAFPGGVGASHTLSDAAASAGLSQALARQVLEASGIGHGNDVVSTEELELLRGCAAAVAAGFPEEALLQVVRVAADSLGKIAETEARLFHYYVHERLRAAGMSGAQLLDTTQQASDQLLPLIEPTLLYFHRRGLAQALREDMLLHIEEEIEISDEPAVPGQVEIAIVFVDLSSFTPLTETMGDAAAADVLNRFALIARDVARRHDGRAVKQIGDAFMLVFPDAQFAVEAAVEIDRRVRDEPLFPAVRGGVQWGKALYREGDYVGTNVNIASRLAAEAEPHQILIAAAVQERLAGGSFVLEHAGARRLKGIAGDIDLYIARDAIVASTAKALDPVCGMELAPLEVAARLSLERDDRAAVFCSEDCLRRFIAAPDRYQTHTKLTAE